MTTRRIFLKSGSLALLSLGCAPSFLARTAQAAPSRKKLLIAIFQRGAVDGLNMVVPYGEADYHRLRPTIAIARPGRADGAAIDLDGFFGLHPRMSALKPFWDRRMLGIVHGSGSPDATRSHFDAQDYMETGTPGVKSTRDGWMNRLLQSGTGDREPGNREPGAGDRGRGTGDGESPLRAVSLTRQMPRVLQGAAPVAAIGSVEEFGVRGGMDAQMSFEEAYAAARDRVLRGTGADAFDAARTVERVRTARYRPAAGVEYPRSPFGQALQEIAALAKADVGLEVAFAESGQWDHHSNEGGATGQLANRLGDLADGMAALAADLGERMADTVIVTMSEFGRAVQENGSRGTDHGHGNAMLVIGGEVKGGRVLGEWPGLEEKDRFEGRDLAITTDFRDVFGEIVTKHLGMSAAAASRVFPGYGVKPTNFRGIL